MKFEQTMIVRDLEMGGTIHREHVKTRRKMKLKLDVIKVELINADCNKLKSAQIDEDYLLPTNK